MIDTWPIESIPARARVIIDNDFGGDPDGILQLAHHLLSPSVEIRAIIGTHLRLGDPWNANRDTVAEAVKAANKIVDLCGMTGQVPVLAGAPAAIVDVNTPQESEGIRFIIEEAMRTDVDTPLYIACGASLTEIASAYLIEPRIAEKLTLVWIGGREHEGLAEQAPGAPDLEYNLHQDVLAGQVIFNKSDINLWQVPRDSYRSCLASRSEMKLRMLGSGPLGQWLYDELARVSKWVGTMGGNSGEAYVLGDSPLVLLTVLQTAFEPDTASSVWKTIPCPTLFEDGNYQANPEGRHIRVYGLLDNRLMFEDMYAKFALLAAGDR
ncbi:MAG: hypothetical protein RL508_361 [Actinomycetota bacterium]|jgi:purine nucleosidase